MSNYYRSLHWPHDWPDCVGLHCTLLRLAVHLLRTRYVAIRDSFCSKSGNSNNLATFDTRFHLKANVLFTNLIAN